ncbi:MAG TPA: lipopolysaccharide heptosyltransferase II [Xanthobacteraceae bacterium]|jgi:heptosyltransferase-2|nr:lipopolysaccharide heptosyltransferase II [Xanthobacteraceae bacterium]
MAIVKTASSADTCPILVVPYMWIGDFVRCHSVVKVLNARWPHRPIDVLTTTRCEPLLRYMPGVRKGITVDLPRRKVALLQHKALGDRLAAENYATVLVMPRTWKSALAPFLAGIPERVGFVGEARFGLINDLRWGESKLPRMIDRCGALALPNEAILPTEWPLPALVVPKAEVAEWRNKQDLASSGLVVALAPGAVGPSKRWPASAYADIARRLSADGIAVWLLGGPEEHSLASEIARAGGSDVHNLTGPDLRNAIVALAAANAAISNDSGLLHVAAALGTPSIGIFGPTSPWHWAPLNPLAATIESTIPLACRPCHKPICHLEHHRCMNDIPASEVLKATYEALKIAAAANV